MAPAHVSKADAHSFMLTRLRPGAGDRRRRRCQRESRVSMSPRRSAVTRRGPRCA